MSEYFETNLYINLLGKIEVLNPITTIKRGYSIVRSNSKSINKISDVKKNDKLDIEVSDGIIISRGDLGIEISLEKISENKE